VKPLSWSSIDVTTHKLCIISLSLLATVGTKAGRADSLDDPYATVNRNPFVQVYGLPAAQSAQLLANQQSRWALQLEAASNFTTNSAGNESIVIDGETHRANLQFRYGLSDTLELGVDLPYLSHEAGRLDNFIDDWHDFFGLPDGGRTDRAQDQIQYTYQQGNQQGNKTLVNVNDSTDGVGDISLSLGYQLSNTATRQWALRGGVKLPTGDADSLQGSESTDVFLGVNVSDQGLLSGQNITLHASAGALWVGGGEVIESAQEDWAVYGSSTLSWRYNEHLSFKTQLDFHSAFYDSELKELGDNSAQLILGGAVKLGQQWTLDLSVSEDIVVDTASDVVFQVGLTFQ
jgi:Protein of unknown function (DUF3187)